MESREPDLVAEEIEEDYLICRHVKDRENIDHYKLQPVKHDAEALMKLFGPESDYEEEANQTTNFKFFQDEILKQRITADEIWDAIQHLFVIDISLRR
ncbi:hypothetical protein VST12_06090 [Lactobacillus delbrueckii subsp. allosunkii]|uniref:hypothetical protein n=1 Tax=Lactobacillus delbrueckii TaxID=1584 RepID=UPI003A8AA5F6